VLTFDKGLWTCFGCKKKYGGKQGGDQIALVSHVLGVPTMVTPCSDAW